jgi:two-component system, sensor histidine kinase and response regulator
MNDGSKKATVMVVDDTPANLKLLSEILEKADYRPLVFPNARMALAAARSAPPDIFLLDIMMPECDGFALCRLLKAEKTLENVPVIFVSALQDSRNKVLAFTQGGVDYITKPFEETEVLARIETHLQIAQQRIQLEAVHQELSLGYEALRKAQDQRDSLVHFLAHDMKSLLVVILGFSEFIEIKAVEKKQKQLVDWAGHVLKAGRSLRSMIANMLTIYQMECDEMFFEKKPLSLRELVEELVADFQKMDEGSTFEISPHSDPITVIGDPDTVRRITANLLDNASKFTKPPGRIRIHYFTSGGQAGVRISDDGPGIHNDAQELIFDRFVQLEQEEEVRKRSSGLGLAFCKMAIIAQDGEIGVESDGVSGSTFWFSLPRVKSPDDMG